MIVMNNQTCTHVKKTEQANPLLNAALFATVALAILPAAIFGAVRVFQSQTADTSAKAADVEAKTPKRTSAAERRAQRLEARKAKEAKNQEVYPEITMETVEPYYDGFGMEYNANFEFNGPGMMPPPYMAGPGMMPPPYMAGPGMMAVPGRGDFNEFGRMPDAGFNNGFGGRRGNF